MRPWRQVIKLFSEETSDSNRRAEKDHQDPHTGADAREGASSRTDTTEEGTAGLEVVEQNDPIRAWKNVGLKGDDHTVYIHSLHSRGHYVSGARATCDRSYQHLEPPPHHHGPVPRLDCSCGWYSAKEVLTTPVTPPYGVVLAEVDLYGTVIEYEWGYRSEYQRILALYFHRDVCRGGFLCDQEPVLLDFPWMKEFKSKSTLAWSTISASAPLSGEQPVRVRRPMPVCADHASSDGVELSRVAARLGVEVRWRIDVAD